MALNFHECPLGLPSCLLHPTSTADGEDCPDTSSCCSVRASRRRMREATGGRRSACKNVFAAVKLLQPMVERAQYNALNMFVHMLARAQYNSSMLAVQSMVFRSTKYSLPEVQFYDDGSTVDGFWNSPPPAMYPNDSLPPVAGSVPHLTTTGQGTADPVHTSWSAVRVSCLCTIHIFRQNQVTEEKSRVKVFHGKRAAWLCVAICVTILRSDCTSLSCRSA